MNKKYNICRIESYFRMYKNSDVKNVQFSSCHSTKLIFFAIIPFPFLFKSLKVLEV